MYELNDLACFCLDINALDRHGMLDQARAEHEWIHAIALPMEARGRSIHDKSLTPLWADVMYDDSDDDTPF